MTSFFLFLIQVIQKAISLERFNGNDIFFILYNVTLNTQKHSELESKYSPRVSKQGGFCSRAHTHRRKAVKTGFFSLVEFDLISFDRITCQDRPSTE